MTVTTRRAGAQLATARPRHLGRLSSVRCHTPSCCLPHCTTTAASRAGGGKALPIGSSRQTRTSQSLLAVPVLNAARSRPSRDLSARIEHRARRELVVARLADPAREDAAGARHAIVRALAVGRQPLRLALLAAGAHDHLHRVHADGAQPNAAAHVARHPARVRRGAVEAEVARRDGLGAGAPGAGAARAGQGASAGGNAHCWSGVGSRERAGTTARHGTSPTCAAARS